ncbi:MAG: S1 RNA-binding domain-containing protein [Monoglobales bacterium]
MKKENGSMQEGEVQKKAGKESGRSVGILTVDASGSAAERESEDIAWHELINAQRTRKVVSGSLGGIERLESGWVVAVVYYKGYRILIPMEEMMINLEGDGRENSDPLNRQTRLANNMLGAELDFIVRELDEKSRSVVASRKEAMLRKRQQFYFAQEEETPMIIPGRIVEARVIAVAPKAVRLEIFGVECSLKARDMSWEWLSDANEKFATGDIVRVMVKKVIGDAPEQLKVEVSAKEARSNVNKENLMRLRKQGKYVGKVTDVYKGTYFICLNCKVNAVAHSCNTTSLPGQGDEVGFLVTRINDEREVAEGIITRIIKRA